MKMGRTIRHGIITNIGTPLTMTMMTQKRNQRKGQLMERTGTEDRHRNAITCILIINMQHNTHTYIPVSAIFREWNGIKRQRDVKKGEGVGKVERCCYKHTVFRSIIEKGSIKHRTFSLLNSPLFLLSIQFRSYIRTFFYHTITWYRC